MSFEKRDLETMTDKPRSERLGLEPGSIDPDYAKCEDRDSRMSRATEREIAHSIAISLKRLADAICGDSQNTGIHLAFLDIANSLAARKDRP